MIHALWRLIRSVAIGTISLIGRIYPPLAYAVADVLAWCAHALGKDERAIGELATQYAQWTGGDREQIARGLARSAARHVVAVLLSRFMTLEQGARYVVLEDPKRIHQIASQGRGVILATWHLGHTLAGTYAAMSASGLHGASIDGWTRPSPPPNIESIGVHDGKGSETGAVLRAIKLLKEGGIIGMPVDSDLGTAMEVSILGREATFRRGAAALARMSGAPVHPVAAYWTKGRNYATIRIGPEIEAKGSTPAEQEQSIADGLARWIENFIVEHNVWPDQGFIYGKETGVYAQQPGSPRQSRAEARDHDPVTPLQRSASSSVVQHDGHR
jgi:lauroyl/myristoyl acyltransferase